MSASRTKYNKNYSTKEDAIIKENVEKFPGDRHKALKMAALQMGRRYASVYARWYYLNNFHNSNGEEKAKQNKPTAKVEQPQPLKSGNYKPTIIVEDGLLEIKSGDSVATVTGKFKLVY